MREALSTTGTYQRHLSPSQLLQSYNNRTFLYTSGGVWLCVKKKKITDINNKMSHQWLAMKTITIHIHIYFTISTTFTRQDWDGDHIYIDIKICHRNMQVKFEIWSRSDDFRSSYDFLNYKETRRKKNQFLLSNFWKDIYGI